MTKDQWDLALESLACGITEGFNIKNIAKETLSELTHLKSRLAEARKIVEILADHCVTDDCELCDTAVPKWLAEEER